VDIAVGAASRSFSTIYVLALQSSCGQFEACSNQAASQESWPFDILVGDDQMSQRLEKRGADIFRRGMRRQKKVPTHARNELVITVCCQQME
jgi:hypothetical protein